MLLKMSLSGGILILFIVIIRMFALHRLPKRVFMLLWSVALLRLLVPAELPLAHGIALPVTEAVEEISAEAPAIMKNAKAAVRTMPENTEASMRKAPGNAGTGTQTSAESAGQDFAVFIWFVGAAFMFLFLGALYIREYRKIREALPVSGEREEYFRLLAGIPGRVKLRISDRIASPVTFGIVKPKIVLPRVLPPENDSQLKFVLIHEMVHIRRADNLWKIVMLLALCIHWFNPAVWMMYLLFNRDMELSCDEKVILLMGEEAKKEYAMTLVNLAEKRRRLSTFSTGFGKNAVKERIEAIMKFKKITVLGVICAVVLTGVSVTAFAQGGYSAENTGRGARIKGSGDRSINRFLADSDDFREYAKFGLSYDADIDRFLYKGKVVGYFHDEKAPGLYVHLTEDDGEVFLAVSRDSSNKIVGLEKVERFPAGGTSEQPSGAAEEAGGLSEAESGGGDWSFEKVKRCEAEKYDTVRKVVQEYAACLTAVKNREESIRKAVENIL